MFEWLFGKKTKDWVGIDLGASAIKVVEIKKIAERLTLANYALLETAEQERGTRDVLQSRFSQDELSNEEIAANLKMLFERAGIKSRRVNISLPIGKTFSTIVEFPMMSEAELAAAVPFEARKYIPVPMEEVALDWSVIGQAAEQGRGAVNSAPSDVKDAPTSDGGNLPASDGGRQTIVQPRSGQAARPLTAFPQQGSGQVGTGLQVLLVAVPKEIIDKLTEIAVLAGLQINFMEQEAFSLARALVGNDQNSFLIVDVGRKSSDIVVVDGGFVRLSHNFESVNKEVLLMEIDRLVNVFKVKYNKNIGVCLLTGGRAQEKALFEFLAAKLKLPVALGNPFARLEFPPALEPALKELGSMLSVAAGLAMREG